MGSSSASPPSGTSSGESYLKCWGCSAIATTVNLAAVLEPCPSCGGQLTVTFDFGRARSRGYWRSKMFARKGSRGRRYMPGWHR